MALLSSHWQEGVPPPKQSSPDSDSCPPSPKHPSTVSIPTPTIRLSIPAFSGVVAPPMGRPDQKRRLYFWLDLTFANVSLESFYTVGFFFLLSHQKNAASSTSRKSQRTEKKCGKSSGLSDGSRPHCHPRTSHPFFRSPGRAGAPPGRFCRVLLCSLPKVRAAAPAG